MNMTVRELIVSKQVSMKNIDFIAIVSNDGVVLNPAEQQAFIFCDNIYYTVNRIGAPNEVEVNVPGAGVFPQYPKRSKKKRISPIRCLSANFLPRD